MLSWRVLFFVMMLMSVRCLVCMYDFNRLVYNLFMSCYSKALEKFVFTYG